MQETHKKYLSKYSCIGKNIAKTLLKIGALFIFFSVCGKEPTGLQCTVVGNRFVNIFFCLAATVSPPPHSIRNLIRQDPGAGEGEVEGASSSFIMGTFCTESYQRQEKKMSTCYCTQKMRRYYFHPKAAQR
jgi:hypothetical protein